VLPRLGLVVVLVLGLAYVMQSVRPNLAYLHLARSLLTDDRQHLEQVAGQVSSAFAVQPTPRRMWDESLMWFRLGQYDRAAEALPAIEPEHLDPSFRVKGMKPSWSFVFGAFTNTESYPVDWQRLVGERPPAEYLILSGMLAAQREDWGEALQLYRLGLVVAPQIYDGAFYQHYYQALAHSPDPVDRQVADSIPRLLPTDLNMGSSPLIIDQYESAEASDNPVSVTEGDCGNLVSFGYDAAALARGPLVPMRFVWACSAEEGGDAGSHLPAQIRVQQVLAVNLIPNSGFEWNQVEGRTYPLGHERSYYHHDNLENRFLTTRERNGVLDNVASIQHAPSTNESSFVPAPIGVSAGACYLHATWAKSLLGNGQMAVRWRGSRISDRLSAHYVGIGRSEEWQLVAQIVQAPSDAAFADAFVGYQATTVPHYFDDHLLVTLPPLPCAGVDALDD
jgi:tetratricopeptide (TPR) repeat protein